MRAMCYIIRFLAVAVWLGCGYPTQTMGSSSKKSGKAGVAKKQASAKQAFKKSSKKGNKKAQNEQLLDLLNQKAFNTIQDATKVRPRLYEIYVQSTDSRIAGKAYRTRFLYPIPRYPTSNQLARLG